ncbi:MAG: hypothetical protein KY476_09030 [Planctomycetes bacterium]|nr:hypothetical protein [Planctomycetota bacterium]
MRLILTCAAFATCAAMAAVPARAGDPPTPGVDARVATFAGDVETQFVDHRHGSRWYRYPGYTYAPRSHYVTPPYTTYYGPTYGYSHSYRPYYHSNRPYSYSYGYVPSYTSYYSPGYYSYGYPGYSGAYYGGYGYRYYGPPYGSEFHFRIGF